MSLRARFKSLSAVAVLAWSVVLPGAALIPPLAQAQQASEAPAVPVTSADTGGTAKISNPYGLDALWKGGDVIARSVLVIMLIMSASTWYIMVLKLIDQQKVLAQAKAAKARFWSARSLEEGKAALKPGTPFWYIADRGMTANQHHEGTLVEQIDLSTWITMSVGRAVEEIQSQLQNGLAVLATVGSTAPFVGLFGTVWGIYHALTAIGISGQASIDKVAGPVGEALIMTAIGLAVAVPAVMGYNLVVRRNKAAMEKVRAFSSDLHSVLLSGGRAESMLRQAA